MGREYFGCIVGKYWIAVQASNCMQQYGAVDLGSEASFKCCGCSVEDQNGEPYTFDYNDSCVGLPDKIYCTHCYDSYDEHLAEAIEEGSGESEETYYVDQTTNWSMTQDNFEKHAEPFIRQNRCLWEKFVVDFKVNEDFEYDVTFKTYLEKETEHIIADLCMLKQILYYFKTTGEYECTWCGEY